MTSVSVFVICDMFLSVSTSCAEFDRSLKFIVKSLYFRFKAIHGLFSLRLIGSTMFSATFNLGTRVRLLFLELSPLSPTERSYKVASKLCQIDF